MKRKICGEEIQKVVEQLEQDLAKLYLKEVTTLDYDILLSHNIEKLQDIAQDLGFHYNRINEITKFL